MLTREFVCLGRTAVEYRMVRAGPGGDRAARVDDPSGWRMYHVIHRSAAVASRTQPAAPAGLGWAELKAAAAAGGLAAGGAAWQGVGVVGQAVKVKTARGQAGQTVKLPAGPDSEYMRFTQNGRLAGSIKPGHDGNVVYSSTGKDMAEWHPRKQGEPVFAAGTVVGISAQGELSRDTTAATMVAVISRQAAVVGGALGPKDDPADHDTICYVKDPSFSICAPPSLQFCTFSFWLFCVLSLAVPCSAGGCLWRCGASGRPGGECIASQSTQQTWTVLHHDGPPHLGLSRWVVPSGLDDGTAVAVREDLDPDPTRPVFGVILETSSAGGGRTVRARGCCCGGKEAIGLPVQLMCAIDNPATVRVVGRRAWRWHVFWSRLMPLVVLLLVIAVAAVTAWQRDKELQRRQQVLKVIAAGGLFRCSAAEVPVRVMTFTQNEITLKQVAGEKTVLMHYPAVEADTDMDTATEQLAMVVGTGACCEPSLWRDAELAAKTTAPLTLSGGQRFGDSREQHEHCSHFGFKEAYCLRPSLRHGDADAMGADVDVPTANGWVPSASGFCMRVEEVAVLPRWEWGAAGAGKQPMAASRRRSLPMAASRRRRRGIHGSDLHWSEPKEKIPWVRPSDRSRLCGERQPALLVGGPSAGSEPLAAGAGDDELAELLAAGARQGGVVFRPVLKYNREIRPLLAPPRFQTETPELPATAKLAQVVCRQVGGPGARAYLATSCRALLMQAVAGRTRLNATLISELCGLPPAWLRPGHTGPGAQRNASREEDGAFPELQQCAREGRLVTPWAQLDPRPTASFPVAAGSSITAIDRDNDRDSQQPLTVGLFTRWHGLLGNDYKRTQTQEDCDTCLPKPDRSAVTAAAQHLIAEVLGSGAEGCSGSERAIAQCFSNQLWYQLWATRLQEQIQINPKFTPSSGNADVPLTGCDLDALVVGCRGGGSVGGAGLFAAACANPIGSEAGGQGSAGSAGQGPGDEEELEITVIETTTGSGSLPQTSQPAHSPVQWTKWSMLLSPP